MAGILSTISPDIQKKHKLNKPYLAKVTVSDLKNLSKAIVESKAKPGGRACNTCCCCCAAAVSPV
jgi:hypothetical protein